MMWWQKYPCDAPEQNEETARSELARHGYTEPGSADQLLESLEALVAEARSEGSLSEHSCEILAATLWSPVDWARERALLALYYHAIWSIDLDEDLFKAAEDDSRSRLEYLEQYCRNAHDEPREETRGRKHWVTINLLRRIPHSDERIESWVRSLGEEERSVFVWERVFAALLGWPGALRIVPDIDTWPIPDEARAEYYDRFVSAAVDGYQVGVRAVSLATQRSGGWLCEVAEERRSANSVRWLFSAAGEAGAPPPEAGFESAFRGATVEGRSGLIMLLGAYLSRQTWDLSAAMRTAVLASKPHETNEYERWARVYLRLLQHIIEHDDPHAYEVALGEIAEPINPPNDRPEVYHHITELLLPMLVRIVRERTVDDLRLEEVSRLLEHPSQFVAVISATLLMEAARAGHDLNSCVAPIAAAAERYSTMLTEEDSVEESVELSDSELRVRTDLGSPHRFRVPDDGVDGEDAMFSLSALAALLESTQAAKVVGRLNEALAHVNPSSSAPAVVRPKDTRAQEDTMNVTAAPVQAGPMTLPEVEELLTRAVLETRSADEATVRVDAMIRAKAAELLQLNREELSRRRRATIRELFEAPPDLLSVPSRRSQQLHVDIFGRAIRGQETDDLSIPIVSCADLGDEEQTTPDSLARYLYRTGLQEHPYRWGIHFCAARVLRLLVGLDALTQEALIRSVAVHELFHAHMEAVLGETILDHSKSVKKSGAPYCRIHEAAANRVAYQWLKDSSAYSANVKERVENILFTPDRLPGYGEYHHIDQDAPASVPRFITAHRGKLLDPRSYGREARIRPGATLDTEAELHLRMWDTLVASMYDVSVPFYVVSG